MVASGALKSCIQGLAGRSSHSNCLASKPLLIYCACLISKANKSNIRSLQAVLKINTVRGMLIIHRKVNSCQYIVPLK